MLQKITSQLTSYIAEAIKNFSSTLDSKKRLLTISVLAVFVAAATSLVARVLISLIDFFTNIAFRGSLSLAHTSPASNTLGLWVIIVPAIGGVVIGLMAFYGSKAIRGHGIPEAMEQILTNESRIKPAITILKPLSAAISIGTGGPFGAEGPIISTGGAFGSTVGQVLKITHYERKILLAAGATAGMSAIFGSPLAAIFLAIELLLFEFSPRSIIPIALACITGSAGHHLLFEPGPVFPVKDFIEFPSNVAIASYSLIGILIGLISIVVTKSVYFIEDAFEKLPVHWMWWPAIGGLAVGLVGYFAPRTLGVGYENITDLLSGSLPFKIVLFLCVLKFTSWSIALGSGTSGGTLAPLLTIGGATGILLAHAILLVFPESNITLPLSALVGMCALFAGASRAVLTSIIFGLETTSQSNALLPLLAACVASYFVSFFFMKNTIMTEKIARRGVRTPHSYESDILERITVAQVVKGSALILNEDLTIHSAIQQLTSMHHCPNHFMISNKEGEFKGVITTTTLFSNHTNKQIKLGSLAKPKKVSVMSDQSLRAAVEIMAKEKEYVLPVFSMHGNTLLGLVAHQDIINAIQGGVEQERKHISISIKRRALKFMIRGRRVVSKRRA
jgi:H+/Cl- antiporter ClcA